MGLLSWLFGAGSSSRDRGKDDLRRTHVANVAGSGEYSFDVVGESHYQRALSRICGGRNEDGHRLEVVATLVHEDDNPHDKNAVRVDIEGETVGYLSRENAPQFREALADAGYSGFVATCPALIVGGWDRGEDDEGHLGVKLDLPVGE